MAKRKSQVKSDEIVPSEDDATHSSSAEEPKKKKAKKDKKKQAKPELASSQGAAVDLEQDLKTNTDGDRYVDLGKLKRTTIRTFKGQTLIDFREYYMDKNSGEAKPGKKGLALNPDNWAALKQAIPLIDAQLEKLK